MAQQVINNGESGLVVRNKLNSMFTELYAAVVLPLKLTGIAGNTQQVIPVDTFLQAVYISATAGTPTIRIGTTPNGEEICPEVQPGSFQPVVVQQYYSAGVTLYITLSGGTVNIRFDVIQDFY
jgi:hypothetical protein